MTPPRADGRRVGSVLRGRPRLFIDAQHGLANRMRTIASADSIARRTGRDLVVIWRPDHHCACRMSDLFDFAGPVIADHRADWCRAQAEAVYNYMEVEPGARFRAPILADTDRVPGDIYIRSAYTLNSPHRRHEDEQIFLRSLVPVQPVLDFMAQVAQPSRLAVHIRMSGGPGYDHLSYEAPANWPAHRHEELMSWRRKSQADRFMARVDTLLEAGRADTIFLAADLLETYTRFTERYGDRMRALRRDLNDRSRRQLQYALADMLLLTAAEHFLASTWSSFSDMAQRLRTPTRPTEHSGLDF